MKWNDIGIVKRSGVLPALLAGALLLVPNLLGTEKDKELSALVKGTEEDRKAALAADRARLAERRAELRRIRSEDSAGPHPRSRVTPAW